MKSRRAAILAAIFAFPSYLFWFVILSEVSAANAVEGPAFSSHKPLATGHQFVILSEDAPKRRASESKDLRLPCHHDAWVAIFAFLWQMWVPEGDHPPLPANNHFCVRLSDFLYPLVTGY
jgi:hypothetical protein